MRTIILERTPYENWYKPIAEYQLQLAEFDLNLNNKNYYENVIRDENGIATYPFDVAEKIMKYWKTKYPFAHYRIKMVNL